MQPHVFNDVESLIQNLYNKKSHSHFRNQQTTVKQKHEFYKGFSASNIQYIKTEKEAKETVTR